MLRSFCLNCVATYLLLTDFPGIFSRGPNTTKTPKQVRVASYTMAGHVQCFPKINSARIWFNHVLTWNVCPNTNFLSPTILLNYQHMYRIIDNCYRIVVKIVWKCPKYSLKCPIIVPEIVLEIVFKIDPKTSPKLSIKLSLKLSWNCPLNLSSLSWIAGVT